MSALVCLTSRASFSTAALAALAVVAAAGSAQNRPPVAVATASTTGGKVPFEVTLSSTGTADPDGDPLKFQWEVAPADGSAARTFATANPTVRFDKTGVYAVTLTVTDSHGAEATKSLTVIAGNTPPAVDINLDGTPPAFVPGKPIAYAVDVSDAEDGTLKGGQIPASKVAFSIDYVPEGFDTSKVTLGDKPVDATARFVVAQAIMGASDCQACHNLGNKSIGPSLTEIAAKYQGDAAAADRLATKIREGGSGTWGEVPMTPHPALSMHEARTVVSYILNVNGTTLSSMPLSGTYTPEIPQGDNGRGVLLLHAAYTDKGADGLPAQTTERLVVLHAARN